MEKRSHGGVVVLGHLAMRAKARYYVDYWSVWQLWEIGPSHYCAFTSRKAAVRECADAARCTGGAYRVRYRGRVIAQWREGKRVK